MLSYYLQTIESEEDKSKFERIYYRYRKLMFHVAMKILNNRQDVEDAVHQAFVSIIENLEKISIVDCPETRSYSVIIVERKSIDILRNRQKVLDVDFEEATLGIEFPPPGDSGLSEAMAKLPVQYREILLLRYDNGYSTKELAKAMNIKQDSVRRMLGRAKEALQAALQEDG